MSESIQELRDRIDLTNPDEIAKIDELERTLKRAMLTKGLGESDAVLMLRATLQDRVSQCNRVLSEDETLNEQERRDIFTRKKVYQWFLKLFTTAEARVENIGGVINKKLGAVKGRK